jgi:DNA-binding GntR family transcriptional regulator
VTTADRSASDHALEELRAMIVSGRIAPGTELSQVGLAETLGISTTPLREALRQLEAEGLVEQRRNRRPRVPPFDPLDLDAVYSNRVLLESLAVSLAVPRMTGDDHAELHAELDAMDAARAAGDGDAWDAAHSRFHARLVAANSAPMRVQIASLMARSDRYRRMSVRADTTGGRETGAEEHLAIVAAAERGDAPEAALLLARHLTRSALAVLAQLAPDADPAGVRGALQMVMAWASPG